jgi:hypothetical protein
LQKEKGNTMEKDIIVRLHQGFEKSVQKEQETGLEFWYKIIRKFGNFSSNEIFSRRNCRRRKM